MKKLSPVKIVMVFIVLSALWIAFSDMLLLSLVPDPRMVTTFSILKGFLYVAITALFLYSLIGQYAAQRDRSEISLRKSQAIIANILDTVPQSVFWKDRASVYLGCNLVFARAAGLEHPDQIIGKTDFDLPWPREEAEAYRADDHEVMENNRPKFHILEPLKQADGTRLLIETTKLPLVDDAGAVYGVLGVFEDITEHKRAENERLFHLHFMESLDRIDTAIREADDLERMLTDVLDAALSLFHADRAWLIHPCDPDAPAWRVRMERTRPEYPGALAVGVELPTSPEVRLAFEEMLNSKGPLVYDPRSGRAVPEVARQFSVRSQIQTVVYPKRGKAWVFGLHQCSHERVWNEQDVRLFTEIARRIADGLSSLLLLQNLRESETRLRTLVQTIPDLIWLKDPDGVYLSCNPMFERFFGAREADIAGKTDYDFVSRGQADLFRENDQKAMAAGRPSKNEEWVTFADDGHRALLDTIKTPMYDAGGRIVGVLGIARDITERRQSEDDLRESEERFKNVFNSADEGILIADAETKKFIMGNRTICLMLQYD